MKPSALRKLLALASAALVFGGTGACIFDSGGDYVGGGRIGDKGALPPEDAGEDDATAANAPSAPTDSGVIAFDS